MDSAIVLGLIDFLFCKAIKILLKIHFAVLFFECAVAEIGANRVNDFVEFSFGSQVGFFEHFKEVFFGLFGLIQLVLALLSLNFLNVFLEETLFLADLLDLIPSRIVLHLLLRVVPFRVQRYLVLAKHLQEILLVQFLRSSSQPVSHY